MSSLVVAVADIECPNCSKLALLEGQQMETIAGTDFSCLNSCHCVRGCGINRSHISFGRLGTYNLGPILSAKESDSNVMSQSSTSP